MTIWGGKPDFDFDVTDADAGRIVVLKADGVPFSEEEMSAEAELLVVSCPSHSYSLAASGPDEISYKSPSEEITAYLVEDGISETDEPLADSATHSAAKILTVSASVDGEVKTVDGELSVDIDYEAVGDYWGFVQELEFGITSGDCGKDLVVLISTSPYMPTCTEDAANHINECATVAIPIKVEPPDVKIELAAVIDGPYGLGWKDYYFQGQIMLYRGTKYAYAASLWDDDDEWDAGSTFSNLTESVELSANETALSIVVPVTPEGAISYLAKIRTVSYAVAEDPPPFPPEDAVPFYVTITAKTYVDGALKEEGEFVLYDKHLDFGRTKNAMLISGPQGGDPGHIYIYSGGYQEDT